MQFDNTGNNVNMLWALFKAALKVIGQFICSLVFVLMFSEFNVLETGNVNLPCHIVGNLFLCSHVTVLKVFSPFLSFLC